MCFAESHGNLEQPFSRELQKVPEREEGAESHNRSLVNILYMPINIKIINIKSSLYGTWKGMVYTLYCTLYIYSNCSYQADANC